MVRFRVRIRVRLGLDLKLGLGLRSRLELKLGFATFWRECNHFAQARKDVFGRRDMMEDLNFK